MFNFVSVCISELSVYSASYFRIYKASKPYSKKITKNCLRPFQMREKANKQLKFAQPCFFCDIFGAVRKHKFCSIDFNISKDSPIFRYVLLCLGILSI